MTALQFEALGARRSAVPLAVLYVDHNVLQLDERNMDDHRYLRSFCGRYGVHYSRPANGPDPFRWTRWGWSTQPCP